MLISKFNLYKSEWLELVFDDRNKNYGAYELRRTYAQTMVKAMIATFIVVGAACAALAVFKGHEVLTHDTATVVNLAPPPMNVEKPAEAKLKPKVDPPKVTTTRDVPPTVVPDNKAEKPVENDKIVGQVGQQTLKGDDNAQIDIPDDKPGTGGSVPAVDNSVHNLGTLDFMPEPVGGAAAWSKFLSKNLRFPAAAQEDGVSGKVLMSFIIEKDGSLSNITVDRGAGHGFDEEALRVLKLAKAWKPGMQNGQPVRVKYTIPINFQLQDN
ncbi:energy transducer TonB [Mucilaginibacter sp. L3T2-6]|uniref:energy transducer TonB n=1 Tax=Mucilaginibacter sp. L3T2-6 TaxID=3062491 RepID=UPI0026755DDC|nr:energy transducer TonB [Mucilaginibacter sp. L3T2-6]MDO3641743.1 TonB family protein [Mucilaginibacter sp. L3T2-6]MDV6214237.1 TonB family protein [Mucilaginibacter sp. L3T2-6]